MHKSSRLPFRLWAFLALSLTLATAVLGQGITTAAMNGLVTDKQGRPVAGAQVTIVHEPSGTRASTVTRSTGQYTMSGLRVGGPYTVSIGALGGLQATSRSDVYLNLDESADVSFRMESDVVQMEAFKITAERDTTFGSDKTSNNNTFNTDDIAATPMIRRDVQEVASLDSRLGLVPNTSTGEFQLSAPGQNFRYNSFLVDGIQTNDSFGLNGNGFSSLRSPVPMDAIQAMSIDLSPYDVRRSGFTGALINAVIKSGTNDFRGSIYGYYTNQNMRAENPLTKQKDTFNDLTYGLTFGGPIIRDKLFFFVAFENFRREAASPTSTFAPDATIMQQIIDKLKTTYNYDAGSLHKDQVAEQKAYLAKLDWNINNDHRLSFTYRRTDGSAPIFADNTSSSSISATTLTTNYNIALSNHWYQQPRITDSYTAQLNSNWTPDLRTEATVAYAKYDGSPINNGSPFPELRFQSIPGTDLNTGAAVTGFVFGGTERSRQLNFIYTKTYNASLFAEYSLDKHTITIGTDWQKDQITNRFVQYILGRYSFTSAANFLQASPIGNLQQGFLYPDYTQEQTSALFSMMNYGFYLMDAWRPTPRLTLTAGLRMDVPITHDAPLQNISRGNPASPLAVGNNTFFPTGNFEWRGRSISTNTYTNSGNSTVAPRVGFNYKFDDTNTTQIRGGAGVFQGRNPTVWLSNSYSNTGAASNTTTNNVAFNPVVSLQTRVIAQGVNITDPNFLQPVYAKGNLAVDRKLPWMGLVLTLAADRSWAMEAPYVVNLNLGAPAAGLSNTLPDGRIRYGAVRPASHAPYGDVLLLTDSASGGSESYTFGVRRPLKDHWSASVSYTRSHSTDVSPMTSSVAFSNWSGRTYTNPNENVASISNYNTPDKIVAMVAREFNFFNKKDAASLISLVYRGQTGHNYSWVYFNDINGDGLSGADLFYMPSDADISSGKVTFATAAQQTAFFQYADSVGLRKYSGQVVGRNRFVGPWQSTVDLHISQNIPISKKFGLDIYFDVLNLANLFDKKMGIVDGIDFPYTRGIVNATVNSAGTQYVYTFGNVPPTQTFTETSRWQLQLGARLKF
jgi:hypothetical protein